MPLNWLPVVEGHLLKFHPACLCSSGLVPFWINNTSPQTLSVIGRFTSGSSFVTRCGSTSIEPGFHPQSSGCSSESITQMGTALPRILHDEKKSRTLHFNTLSAASYTLQKTTEVWATSSKWCCMLSTQDVDLKGVFWNQTHPDSSAVLSQRSSNLTHNSSFFVGQHNSHVI